jgi:biotin carboxyl carrier protein
MRRILEIGGEESDIWLSHDGTGYALHAGDRALRCALLPAEGNGAYVLDFDGQCVPVRLAVGPEATFVHLNGCAYRIGRSDLADRLAGAGTGASDDRVLAPMPGVVVSVAVAAGDAVEEGQPILVIESMKLETTLRAPRAGVVAELPFGPGDGFGLRNVLARLAPQEE